MTDSLNRTDSQPSTTSDFSSNKQNIVYGGLVFILILMFLLIMYFILKRVYRKYYKTRRSSESLKSKKTEAIKSMYDDKFGIIENEHENIRDKSMIKEFLESNVDFQKKKDEKNDDKNFNYISAKNVFNIEGEESEYHIDSSKKYSNKESSGDEYEEELGQFSQDLEKNQEDNLNSQPNEKNENSVLNVLN